MRRIPRLVSLGTGQPSVVVLSTVSSDAHTWNLVYLQLLLEEAGYAVVNLGPCVPDNLIIAACREYRPAMLVISTVNGHGGQDALRLIQTLRRHPDLARLQVVIGGKLGVRAGEPRDRIAALLEAGFSAVFDEEQATAAPLLALLYHGRLDEPA